MNNRIMAKFHFSSTIGHRGGGSGGMKADAAAAAAYMRREKRKSTRDGEVYDFTMKRELVWKGVILSEDAPSWAKGMKTKDTSETGQMLSESLWNMVEMREKRVDSQLYIRDIVAIPIELNKERGIDLVKRYVTEVMAVDRNFCDVAVHWNKGNPHAHIMMPAFRKLTDDGLSMKEKLTRGQLRERLVNRRNLWAQYCNESLERNGFDGRVDPRSYKDQGIDLIPTQHEGRHIAGRYHVLNNEFTRMENLSRIELNPEILTRKMASGYASFNREDVELELSRYTSPNVDKIERASKELFARMQFRKSVFTGRELRNELRKHGELTVQDKKNIVDRVLMSDQIIRLGEGDDGREHYTTQSAYKTENEMLHEAKVLHGMGSNTISNRAVENVSLKYTLNPDQARVLKYITQGADLEMVRGMAGTGKTYLLKAAYELWQEDGRKVWGVTVAGKAARGLEEGSGIKSFTMDSFLLLVGKGEVKFQKGDVVVVDEVGMMTLDRMNTLVKIASISGMKLIAVGDPEQAQPIGRGAPAKALMEQCGAVTLTEIIRQRSDWMKEATFYFETGETGRGLDMYNAKGLVKIERDKDAVIGLIINDWTQQLKDHGWDLKGTMMTAYTNKTVDRLNLDARNFLVQSGMLQEGKPFRTEYGKLDISKGERIQFRKNNRSVGVINGDIGTVSSIEGHVLKVQLESGKEVQFNPDSYRFYNYGYASTVHKLQGHTTNSCLFYADSKGIDRHVLLVGASRHRDGLIIYADENNFKAYGELKRVCSREAINDNIIDYPVSFSVRRGSDREYAGKQGVMIGAGIRHSVRDAFRWLFNYQEAIERPGPLPISEARQLAKVAADFSDRRWDIYEDSKRLRDKKGRLEELVVSKKQERDLIQKGGVSKEQVDMFISQNEKVRVALKEVKGEYTHLYKERLASAEQAQILQGHYGEVKDVLLNNNILIGDIDDVLAFKKRDDEAVNALSIYRRHGTIPVQAAERFIGSQANAKKYWNAISENTQGDYERTAFVSELKLVSLRGRLKEMRDMDGGVKSAIIKYAEMDAALSRARAELYSSNQAGVPVRKERIAELEHNYIDALATLKRHENVIRNCEPLIGVLGDTMFKSYQQPSTEQTNITRHEELHKTKEQKHDIGIDITEQDVKQGRSR